jgi:hypothetical protein
MDISRVNLFDASVFVAIMNLVNTTINVMLMIRMRTIQANREILADLKEESVAKDQIIKYLRQSVKSYKKLQHTTN